MKRFLSDKGVGFYVSALILLIMLALAVVYPVLYSGSGYYNIWAQLFLVFGPLSASAVWMTRLREWMPAALWACCFTSMLLFVSGAWDLLISAAFRTGGNSAGLTVIVTLYLTVVLLSIVNVIFLEQIKVRMVSPRITGNEPSDDLSIPSV